MGVSGPVKIRAAIDETIATLRSLIESAVRAEQLRHQLTGLPNQQALDEAVQRAVNDARSFWLAFIEIDKFKTINDRFGYQRADALLQEVAQTLETAAPRYFADQAIAFHAHGDEFYVLGLTDSNTFSDDQVHAKLDAVRMAVEHIALSAGEGALMKCTVSVGWTLRSRHVHGTARELMRDVEAAVAHAKHAGRNRVLRFDESMAKSPYVGLRADCAACRASFSLEVPAMTEHRGDLFCPNCGMRSMRPADASRAAESTDITDLSQVPQI